LDREESYKIEGNLLEIDTLIMRDNSKLILTQSPTTLIVHNAFISYRCRIDGSGKEEADSMDLNGKDLNLYINLHKISSLLIIDLSGKRRQCKSYYTECAGVSGNLQLKTSLKSKKYIEKIKLINGGYYWTYIGSPAGAYSIFEFHPDNLILRYNERQGTIRNLSFFFPPPKPSASIPINIKKEEKWNLGNVGEVLRVALDSCGYKGLRYYQVPNGFALITRMEQITKKGKPLPDRIRWLDDTRYIKEFSIVALLKALLTVNKGYYRTIVFVVTSSENFSSKDGETLKKDVESWFKSGLYKLPLCTAEDAYTDKHYLTALIYEFKVSEKDQKPVLSPFVDVKKHLELSNIWQSLKLN